MEPENVKLTKGFKHMTKSLKVIEPFFGMEAGDEMKLSQDGKMYVSEYSSEYHADDEDDTASAVYNSTCSVSKDYAEQLVKEGYLEEIVPKQQQKIADTQFVNVFDEIDSMITTYQTDLANIDIDERNTPEALKVEKKTVLHNLIKALNHLKNLRK